MSIPSSGRASPSLCRGWTKNKQKHKLNHVPGLTHGLDQKSEAGHPQWTYGGKAYVNSNLVVQAPYTPSRTVWQYILWQVNDPLVHYLASDLNTSTRYTGPGYSDDLTSKPMPTVSLNTVADHYQPWGRNTAMAYLGNGVDSNQYNLGYRDPLVWGSDYWNFPSGQGLPLSTLGRIHRGTPWQTVYLKATDIMQETVTGAFGTGNVGVNTWMQWTGNMDPNDAALTAPISDRYLLGVLVPLMNTNDPAQLLSVNDINLADWVNVMNGFVVLTNSTDFPTDYTTPQFDAFIVSASSPQAWFIANAIAQTRTNISTQHFQSIGEILQTSALSEDSPWLNTNSSDQISYGISDEAYEAIPSQLLPLLRLDSVGAVIQANGSFSLQFSGSDGYAYILETSTNLINWDVVSTNYPIQGSFCVPISPMPDSQKQFYRSVLR